MAFEKDINDQKERVDYWDKLSKNDVGYSADIFKTNKGEYYREDLLKNPDFQKAARLYYEMRHDKKQLPLDQMSAAHKAEVLDYAYQNISLYNNNLAFGLNIARDVMYGEGTTDEQRIAFQFLNDAYLGASWSKEDVKNFAVQGVLMDPLTYLSFGTGKVAAQGVKMGAQNMVKGAITKKIASKMQTSITAL